MSERDIDKLDPELQKLLDAEADYSDMPADAAAKLFARVSSGIDLPKGGGGKGGGEGNGEGAGKGGPNVDGKGTSSGVGPGAAATTTSWTAAKTAVLVSFGAGAIVGVAGHATYERVTTDPVAHVEVIPSAVPPISNSAPINQEPTPSAVASSNPPLPSTHPVLPSLIMPKTDDAKEDQDLADERAQLEVARTALARGQSDAALVTLRADAAKHPKSRLVEEREMLFIQALALSGKAEEASARANAFRRKYPKSLFLPVIDAAFASEVRDR